MTTPTETMLLATMRQIKAGRIDMRPWWQRLFSRGVTPQFAATAVLDVIGRGEKDNHNG